MRKLLALLAAMLLSIAQPALGQTNTSNNSGYTVIWDGVHPFTYVGGCSTIPQIMLGTTVDATHQFNYNGTWVGFGGAVTPFKLAQTGETEQISTASTFAQIYGGFYATGNGGVVSVSPGTYNPGDIVCKSVTCTLNCTAGSTTATVVFTQNDCPQTMTDAACIAATPGSPGATNWTYTHTLTNITCDFKSVEWVTEDISYGAGLYPFAAFGYVPFRDATCEAPGSVGQCGGSSPVNPNFITSNQFILQNGTGNSYPSAPVGSGDGFNVCYSASVTISCDNVAGLRNSAGISANGN